jgi:hypothetical protein
VGGASAGHKKGIGGGWEELLLVTNKELMDRRNFSWSFRLLFWSVFLLNHILLLILLFLLILHILIVLTFFNLGRKIQML